MDRTFYMTCGKSALDSTIKMNIYVDIQDKTQALIRFENNL